MVKKEEDVINPRMSDDDRRYLIESLRRQLVEKATTLRVVKQEISDLHRVLKEVLEDEN